MGASRLFDLSRVLGVPVSWFFDDMPPEVAAAGPAAMRAAKSDPVIPVAADDDEARRETLQLARALDRLSPADLAAVAAMMKALGG